MSLTVLCIIFNNITENQWWKCTLHFTSFTSLCSLTLSLSVKSLLNPKINISYLLYKLDVSSVYIKSRNVLYSVYFLSAFRSSKLSVLLTRICHLQGRNFPSECHLMVPQTPILPSMTIKVRILITYIFYFQIVTCNSISESKQISLIYACTHCCHFICFLAHCSCFMTNIYLFPRNISQTKAIFVF